MPVDWKKYPSNWHKIAFELKESVGWVCENCGRVCRRKGESIEEFVARATGDGDLTTEEANSLEAEIREKPVRFTLTVAHINHSPMDTRREVLRCWCSGCHCRFDAAHKKAKTRRKRGDIKHPAE